MLRGFIALLVVANVAWFAWARGHLRAFGLEPVASSEPQRMAQQVRPEALRVLPQDPRAPAAAESPSAAAAAPSASQTESTEDTPR